MNVGHIVSDEFNERPNLYFSFSVPNYLIAEIDKDKEWFKSGWIFAENISVKSTGNKYKDYEKLFLRISYQFAQWAKIFRKLDTQ